MKGTGSEHGTMVESGKAKGAEQDDKANGSMTRTYHISGDIERRTIGHITHE